jgi:hypothetical protein
VPKCHTLLFFHAKLPLPYTVKETLLVNLSGFSNLPKLSMSKEKEKTSMFFLAIPVPSHACSLFYEEGHGGALSPPAHS